MRADRLLVVAVVSVIGVTPGVAAPMSCPATLAAPIGDVDVPDGWLRLPNFFPPASWQIPLTSTSFGTDGSFYCQYQAGPKSLGIWKQIPTNCTRARGTWYASGVPTVTGWTCYGAAQNCTFNCN